MFERQTDRQTGFLEVICLGKARVSPFLHNNRVCCALLEIKLDLYLTISVSRF